MKFEKISRQQYMTDFQYEDTFYAKDDEHVSVDVLVNSVRVSEEELGNRLPNMTRYPLDSIYEYIKLPQRATKMSAGYDFFAPYSFVLYPGDSIKISTGIKVNLDPDKVLMIFPRSGLGFKARVQLDNTCGIIDADYIESKNEGHILLKLTNDSRTGKVIKVNQGDGMAQGIITKYYITEDDEVTTKRDGGFGSTTKEVE